MKHLVIGAKGQVGSALYAVLHGPQTTGIDAKDDPPAASLGKFEVLHICLPYNEEFDASLQGYVNRYLVGEGLIIIHSTVQVGTSTKHQAVHSPIRGVHPHLTEGIRTFTKFFGGPRAEEAASIFRTLGITCVCTEKAESTEALKLWDTTQYGWMILIEKAVKAYCEEKGLDFDIVYTQANESYNRGFTELGMPQVVRPVLKDFPGKTGGHCILPNAKILGGEIAEFILKTNEKL